jgi:hypothetical protein
MAFKLPNRPSPRSSASELADFAELLALLQGRCSATEIQRYLSRIDENEFNVGIEDDDVINEGLSDAMMTEIGYRITACSDGYPFITDRTGSILIRRDDAHSTKALIYRYLLLATRLNMSTEKLQAGIDGTQIMEELGSAVLGNYLGNRAEVEVFGTARQGGFAQKIGDLCASLSEGGRFRNIDTGILSANDDGLDVVGWIPFSDNLPAKLSVFGQCKTGTSWHDHLYRLNPKAFITRWMSGTVIVDPVKAYFIAESADRAQWNGVCVYGGILFDRCRIVDFSDSVEVDLIQQIQSWTDAAFQKLNDWDWN